MAAAEEIVSFCDALLAIGEFDDYCPNGLQVPGADEVERVVTGVSANLELLLAATGERADLVVVHHGLFWDRGTRALSPALAERLRVVLESRISLCGYHLPLDAHPEVGNNALLCAGLGLEQGGRFAEIGGSAIGVIGVSADPISPGELSARVANLTGREPLAFEEGPGEVRSVGIVSGGGASSLEEAAVLGLDAMITGEPNEPARASARESGIHFIAAGHHATETFGIRRLGELIGERFGVEHRFIEVPNPI
jgi:dinuclear metal center YbgI/SA1388 family protein